MKAALQGRTKSAKLLLFAGKRLKKTIYLILWLLNVKYFFMNVFIYFWTKIVREQMIGASATSTDPARGFRADQWSRYCGRHQTAEMIETTARAKLLDKSASNKLMHDSFPRSKTSSAMTQNSNIIQQQPSQSGGKPWRSKIDFKLQNIFKLINLTLPWYFIIYIHFSGFRSKFRKVFPFSIKDKPKTGKNQNGFVDVSEKDNTNFNGDIVNYLTAAALCVGGGPAISASNKQIIKSFCRPLEVPKWDKFPLYIYGLTEYVFKVMCHLCVKKSVNRIETYFSSFFH